MEVGQETMEEFLRTLIKRGLGLYGREKMAKICYDSGIALMDDDTIDFLDENVTNAVNALLINYAKFNLPARMTVMVLAKKYGIPLPEELRRKKKRRSRFLRLISRK